jgi:hypothetical protein
LTPGEVLPQVAPSFQLPLVTEVKVAIREPQP